MTTARTSPLAVVALVVALLAVLGVVWALAWPLNETVTFTDTASINGPSVHVVDVDCGSPFGDGPGVVVDSQGNYTNRPCEDAIGTRRTIAGVAGCVAVVSGVVVVVAERKRRATAETISS